MIYIEENGLRFEINQENFTSKIIFSPNSKGNIVIPQSINYNSKEYKISTICEGSFKNNKRIKSIEFTEDSELLSIEKDAFYCSSLQSISIPASLIELQECWCAFTLNLYQISISTNNKNFSILDDKIIIGKSNPTMNTKYDILIFACRYISTVSIPASIKRISSYAFNGCMQLQTIEIPEDSELEIIDYYSFSSSSLKSIFIPAKLAAMRDGWCNLTFYLNNVSISPKNRHFKFIENSNQKLIVTKSNNEDFDSIVFACRNIERAFIPSKIKHITSFSFQSCRDLNEIEFEENSELESIGEFAFSRAALDQIKIPPQIRSIGRFAFESCFCLQKVDLSKSSKLKRISEGAFKYTALISISIPACVEAIEERAFFYCLMLSRIEFSEGSQLNSIGNEAFGQTSLQKVVIPRHVTHIGESVFVNLGSQLSIEFENECDIKFFDQKSFKSDSIVKLTIPKSVTELKDGWCEFTPNLTTVVISPENENLTYVSQDKKLIAQRSDQIKNGYDTLVFSSRDVERAVIPPHIRHISPYSFEKCMLLKSIEFSEDSELNSIGDFAFEYATIEKVSIPKKVKCIGKFAFFNCSKLADVELQMDSDLISVGESAFSNTIIEKVSIPKNIKEVGTNSFNSCVRLNAVEVFGECFSVEKFCFSFCSRLSVFSMPNAKVASLSLCAFSNGFDNLTIYALANSKIIILE